MKRVSISIRGSKNSENPIKGHALVSELHEHSLWFYSTEKLPIDEELEITVNLRDQVRVYKVILAMLREEISTGRIMTDVPSESHPFPARKFFLCFAREAKAAALTVVPTVTATQPTEAPTPVAEATPESAAPAEAAPAAQAA